MSKLAYGDPNEAVYFDRDALRMVLASGDRVPIVQFVDEDDEEVQLGDLDLHDRLRVVCGPLANGNMLVCAIGTRDKLPEPAGNHGQVWQENRVH